MSAPTRIYLLLVFFVATMWTLGAYLVGAGAGELVFRGDAHYMLQHADRLPAVVQGRVVLRDHTGGEIAIPPSTLTVSVSARDASESLAVRRFAPVDENGLFEVMGLPVGVATVAVQLGGGDTIWQQSGIVVGRAGVHDERLQPIDLGDRLFPASVSVIGPSGEPAPEGHLMWRRTKGASDERTFEGDAPIHDGVATFLTTAPLIDVVALVPGAATELFEGLWGDERIDLAPGVTARIRPVGQVPSSDDWTLHLILQPVDLLPRLAYDEDALQRDTGLFFAVDDGVAVVPLARGGRYRLSWWAVPVKGHRFDTLRLSGEARTIEIPPVAGQHEIDVQFPIDEFAREASRR